MWFLEAKEQLALNIFYVLSVVYVGTVLKMKDEEYLAPQAYHHKEAVGDCVIDNRLKQLKHGRWKRKGPL